MTCFCTPIVANATFPVANATFPSFYNYDQNAQQQAYYGPNILLALFYIQYCTISVH